jgi:hypothetical protein
MHHRVHRLQPTLVICNPDGWMLACFDQPSASLALIIRFSIRLVRVAVTAMGIRARSRTGLKRLRNLERQPLQLGCASDGAKQVLGGNDARQRLFVLFVLNLRLIT